MQKKYNTLLQNKTKKLYNEYQLNNNINWKNEYKKQNYTNQNINESFKNTFNNVNQYKINSKVNFIFN